MRETPSQLIHGNSLSSLLLVSGEVSLAETVNVMGVKDLAHSYPFSIITWQILLYRIFSCDS